MPYRRLPNTDQARLRALRAALKVGTSVSPVELAFSQKLLWEIKSFYPHFEQVLTQYQQHRDRQVKTGRLLGEHFKSARQYVSHFIQVVNLCILRGELKPDVRKYYALSEDERSVPELGTEIQLLNWGKVLISGEEARMATGATRIYNPSLAMVRVKYERFVEYYNIHKDLLATTQKLMDKVTDYRSRADSLVTQLWNEIETFHDSMQPNEKREACSNYGVTYAYRPAEKSLPSQNGF